MIAFIDMYRDQFGVELICRILRAAIPGFLTSRGYRAARTRPASDREIRDEQLIAEPAPGAPAELLGLRCQEDARRYDPAGLASGARTNPQVDAQSRPARCPTRKAGVHHGHRPCRSAASGPGQPPVPRTRAQPALGRRHHLCADLAGILLHRVRHRCLYSQDRRLGRGNDDAY